MPYICGMLNVNDLRFSKFHNRVSDTGARYAIAEIGVVFGFELEDGWKYYEVTNIFNNSQPMSGNVNLFHLEKHTGVQPVVFIHKEDL